MLRVHVRHNPTLDYSDEDDMVKMLETVIGKLTRERGLHAIAAVKEE